MRTFNTTLIAALALLPAAAYGEDIATDDDQIVVTASRYEKKLADVGQSITMIDRQLIEQRQTTSVADLLRTTPGVTLVRNGGPGGFTSIFIRGAQSEQTVALIDGVKLNDPSSPAGGFNFADLLTDSVDRIEILRGPQSVLWGSQAIGGVINLITREPTEELGLRATGEYGSHNEGHLTGNVTGTAGPVAFSAGAGYLATDGISAFDGGAERDGYDLFGANVKTVVTLTNAVSLDLRGLYTKSKIDLDLAFPFNDSSDYQRQEQIVGYAGLNAALFDGRLKNRLAASYTLVDRDSYDPAQTPSRTLRGRGRNVRFEYQGVAEVTDWALATFGAEHQKENYRTASIYSFPPLAIEKKRANIDSVYGDLHVKPVAGLSFGAGIRYDDHSGFGSATTKSADISWSPNGGMTRIRTSYGEGFKAPSLYQLYGDFGFAFLVPEKAKGWDAGITQKLFDGAVELRATYFQRKVREQIDFDLGTFTYSNFAAVRARGVELEATLRPASGLTIDANYTYTKSVNREPTDPNFGKDLPRRPRNSLNVSADYDWAFGLKTGATVTHVTHSFDTASNAANRRLAGYTLVDLRAAYPVSEHIELFGRIDNLFDERYQTAFGFGQERRTVHAGVRLSY